jgi:hypothetical protein
MPVEEEEKVDSASYTSHAPLNTYPPSNANASASNVNVSSFDPERNDSGSRRGHARTGDHPARPGLASSPSWDLFAGARSYDAANATEAHLAFADGDVPNTPVRRRHGRSSKALNAPNSARSFL